MGHFPRLPCGLGDLVSRTMVNCSKILLCVSEALPLSSKDSGGVAWLCCDYVKYSHPGRRIHLRVPADCRSTKPLPMQGIGGVRNQPGSEEKKAEPSKEAGEWWSPTTCEFALIISLINDAALFLSVKMPRGSIFSHQPCFPSVGIKKFACHLLLRVIT